MIKTTETKILVLFPVVITAFSYGMYKLAGRIGLMLVFVFLIGLLISALIGGLRWMRAFLKKELLPHLATGIHEYNDYNDYKQIQVEGNKRKIDDVWVTEENIKLLSEYIEENVPDPEFGICHGTRRGKEQEWFRKYLDIKVIGTEISPTATQFPHTIEWDFHEVKQEWIDNIDFIYSNSLDHSYDPEACLDTWMSCVKKDGICIIEWTPEDVKTTELDPFGATLKEYKDLVSQTYELREVLEGHPTGHGNDTPCYYLIVTHTN